MQSDAARTSGVYASFASLMKFGGTSWELEAPHTFHEEGDKFSQSHQLATLQGIISLYSNKNEHTKQIQPSGSHSCFSFHPAGWGQWHINYSIMFTWQVSLPQLAWEKRLCCCCCCCCCCSRDKYCVIHIKTLSLQNSRMDRSFWRNMIHAKFNDDVFC